jgi:hypothetical protein
MQDTKKFAPLGQKEGKSSNSSKQAACEKCKEVLFQGFEHCKYCCVSFDSAAGKHCFKCCQKGHSVSVLPADKHCCHCHQCWNEPEQSHCKKRTRTGERCCVVTPKDIEHCCECKKVLPQGPRQFIHCEGCCSEYPLGKRHCCECQVDYDPATHAHCCKCNMVENKDFLHCCDCKISYDGAIHNHCCKYNKLFPIGMQHCCNCNIEWDPATHTHCCNCTSKITPINLAHCCQCQKRWDPKTHTHCHTCDVIFDVTCKHCCNHHQTWDPDTSNHCCKCNVVWDLHSRTHCCKCGNVSRIGEDHCCKCAKTLPLDAKMTHCNDCCLIHSVKEDHCCGSRGCKKCWPISTEHKHCKGCHTSWNAVIEIHCARQGCCVTYPISRTHCCKCKSSCDAVSEKHCDTCCATFRRGYSHCHTCKKSWDPASKTQHCSKCCTSFANGNEHCCLCGKDWNRGSEDACSCGKVRSFFSVKIREFLTKKGLDNNHVVSPCLGQDCQSVVKFVKAIRSLGFQNLDDFLKDETNYTMMMHGTPRVDGASDICCKSWDLGKRNLNGQAIGTGEYFTNTLGTAHHYATHFGAVVITIVINPVAFPKHRDNVGLHLAGRHHTFARIGFTSDDKPTMRVLNHPGTDEVWFIVENTADLAFCLPVGVMQHHQPIDSCSSCPRRKAEISLRELLTGKGGAIGFDDQGFRPYAKADLDAILQNARSGIFVFNITATNGATYSIDLNKMVQTNLSTSGQRRILVQ